MGTSSGRKEEARDPGECTTPYVMHSNIYAGDGVSATRIVPPVSTSLSYYCTQAFLTEASQRVDLFDSSSIVPVVWSMAFMGDSVRACPREPVGLLINRAHALRGRAA